MTPNNNKKCPLTELAEGRVDDTMFVEFLKAYGFYWHHCRAKGRIDEGVFDAAERNAIAYAAGKEMRLEFDDMSYKLEPASERENESEWPDAARRSSYAPSYQQLSYIIGEAINHISTMWPKEPGDVAGISLWLKDAKRFFAGSRRIVRAKQKLHRIYKPTMIEPQRNRDICELLWCYRHLFYFVGEETYDAVWNVTQYRIEIELDEFLPPFNEHGMKADDVVEYSHKILKRMLDLNMLTEIEQEDTDKLVFDINEPEAWC